MKLIVFVGVMMSFFVTPVHAKRNSRNNPETVFIMKMKIAAETAEYGNLGGWSNGYLSARLLDDTSLIIRCGEWSDFSFTVEMKNIHGDEQRMDFTMDDPSCSAYVSQIWGQIKDGASLIELLRRDNGKATLNAY